MSAACSPQKGHFIRMISCGMSSGARNIRFMPFCPSRSTPFLPHQNTPGKPTDCQRPGAILPSRCTSRTESEKAFLHKPGQVVPPGYRNIPSGSLVLPFSLKSLGFQDAGPDELLLFRRHPQGQLLQTLCPHLFRIPGLADGVSGHDFLSCSW